MKRKYLNWILILLGCVAGMIHPAGAVGFIAIGAVVNASTLIGLQQSFNAIFQQAMEAIKPYWPTVAMEAPSTGREENYQWLGDLPAMREWTDEKFLKELRGFYYAIVNKSWEATVKVNRDDISDDKLGIYKPRILQLANEAVLHIDRLLSDVRIAGTSGLCYDGTYFYTTTHTAIGSSGVQSNLLTGTGVTIDKIAADFITARAKLRTYKTDSGKPFIRDTGKLQLHATIPAALEGVFELLQSATIINGTDNQLKGAFTFTVDSNLTRIQDWYLDYIGSPIKPFVVQMREKPHFVPFDALDSAISFLRKLFLYSVEGRYNVGYALWQYSVKITNA